MLYKRMADISVFDNFIVHVPDDVYDAYSYVRGVEDVLRMIRSLKTEDEEEGLEE